MLVIFITYIFLIIDLMNIHLDDSDLSRLWVSGTANKRLRAFIGSTNSCPSEAERMQGGNGFESDSGEFSS